nr:immunoglobulin light chain junction region [Macaca mulatta]
DYFCAIWHSSAWVF